MKNITSYIEFTENPDCKSLKDFTGFCLSEKNIILDYLKKYDCWAVMAHAYHRRNVKTKCTAFQRWHLSMD